MLVPKSNPEDELEPSMVDDDDFDYDRDLDELQRDDPHSHNVDLNTKGIVAFELLDPKDGDDRDFADQNDPQSDNVDSPESSSTWELDATRNFGLLVPQRSSLDEPDPSMADDDDRDFEELLLQDPHSYNFVPDTKNTLELDATTTTTRNFELLNPRSYNVDLNANGTVVAFELLDGDPRSNDLEPDSKGTAAAAFELDTTTTRRRRRIELAARSNLELLVDMKKSRTAELDDAKTTCELALDLVLEPMTMTIRQLFLLLFLLPPF